MEYETAKQLERKINTAENVSWSQVVMFTNNYSDWAVEGDDRWDETSNTFEVEFHAYDAVIPSSVVQIVGKFPEDIGFYIGPDSHFTST